MPGKEASLAGNESKGHPWLTKTRGNANDVTNGAMQKIKGRSQRPGH